MTSKLLNRLPEHIVSALNVWKSRYHDSRFDHDIARAEIRGYIKALRDCNIIESDIEYRLLFSYCTV